MIDIKNTHGGPGRGGGRKSKYSEPMQNVTIAMTDTHRETIQKLGGLQVLRDWLDKQAKRKTNQTEEMKMTTTLKESAKLWIDGVNDADAPELAPLIDAWEKCADDLTLCEFAEHVLCES